MLVTEVSKNKIQKRVRCRQFVQDFFTRAVMPVKASIE
jgi:hypothetical protein